VLHTCSPGTETGSANFGGPIQRGQPGAQLGRGVGEPGLEVLDLPQVDDLHGQRHAGGQQQHGGQDLPEDGRLQLAAVPPQGGAGE
jgi:hypothetical protein